MDILKGQKQQLFLITIKKQTNKKSEYISIKPMLIVIVFGFVLEDLVIG